MIPVLIAAEALAWLLVLLLLWWAAQHGAAEYRRGYRAGRASLGGPVLCDVPVAVPGGQGLCGRPAAHPGAHAAAWTPGGRR